MTVPALWRVLDDLAVQGRNGTCALREILMDRGDGYVAPASELERRFIDIVRRAGLPVPERELDLGDADHWIGRVDFVFRAAKLIVEVDGRMYHTAFLDIDADHARDRQFVELGYRTARYSYADVKDNPLGVERSLRRSLRAAA